MPTKPKTSKFLAVFPQEVKQLSLELRYEGVESLSEPERLEVAAATKDILDSQRQISRSIFEIGRRVFRVQQILTQENTFLSWLETVFPRQKSSAYLYLDVYLRYRDSEAEYFKLTERAPESAIALLAGADRKILEAAQDYPELTQEVPLATTVALEQAASTDTSITYRQAQQIASQTKQQTKEALQERQYELNRDKLIAAGLDSEIANKLKATEIANHQWELRALISLSSEDRALAADLILSGETKNAREAKRLIIEEQERQNQPIDAEFEQIEEQQAIHHKTPGNWLDWWKEQAEESADLIWCNAPMATDKVENFRLYAAEALRTLREGGCILVILPDDSLDQAIGYLKEHGLKWGRPIALHLGQGSSQSVGKYCVDDVRLLGPFFKGSRRPTAWTTDGKPYPAFYNRSFGSFEAAADNLVRRLSNPWDTSWVLGADTTIWERFCLEDRHAIGVGLS
jgi:peptidoglycan/xylan/chitin deacetylase (PgdA/CDA1 family)